MSFDPRLGPRCAACGMRIYSGAYRANDVHAERATKSQEISDDDLVDRVWRAGFYTARNDQEGADPENTCGAVLERIYDLREQLRALREKCLPYCSTQPTAVSALGRVKDTPRAEPMTLTNVWPDGQIRPEDPYRCGAFLSPSGEQCTKLSDHDGDHSFENHSNAAKPLAFLDLSGPGPNPRPDGEVERFYQKTPSQSPAHTQPAMPRVEECRTCDGCGWYEGGKTLKTTCHECNGTGVKPVSAEREDTNG